MIFLVVDDEPDMLEFLADAVEMCGHQAVQASSEGEIDRALAGHEIFGVIVDIVMPSLDGIEVMNRLAEDKFTGPVVPISGKDRNQLTIASRLAEARGLTIPMHLEKPIRLDEIENAIKSLVNAD